MEARKDNRGRRLKKGEIVRKSDGRFCFSYSDALGRRRYIYDRDLLSLREKEEEIQRDLLDGLDLYQRKTATLNATFDRYMKTKYGLRGSSEKGYYYMYDHFVRNTIGGKLISSFKFSDIMQFYLKLLKEDDIELATLDNVHCLLHPTFQMAVRDGLLRLNPTEGVMREIKKSKYWVENKRKALTIDQQTKFMDFVRSNREYTGWLPIITILLGTGLRIGEALGLLWTDIDFENRTLSVERAMNDRPDGDGICRKRIQSPKTKAAYRDIPLVSEVVDAFLAEYELQKWLGFCEEEIDGYSGFVFSNSAHMVYVPGAINRALHQIVTDYNNLEDINAKQEHREPDHLPYFSCHVLRHTFCSRLCENEPNPKIAQEIMGHSDIQTTLDVYTEIDKSVKKKHMLSLEGKILI